MAIDGKSLLRNLLLGTGVVILTPILAGVIPEIMKLGNVITVGQALSAGVAAFVTDWVLDMVFKKG